MPLPTDKDNTTELPLLGKYSIAKTLEIKSEISSKLSNMLAISANSTIPNKATLSTNGDSFGFINTNFIDRYITDRLEITGSNQDKKNNDAIKTSAAQFNSTISDFYSKINPSQTTVGHATNYYIEKMTTLKNDEYATRASFMIPVSVNLTTDGISGFNMGQAFTIPDKLLPYTYSSRKTEGFSKDRTRNVGFVAVGLTHKIENNQWDTSIRANMIFLKNKTEFKGDVKKLEIKTTQFGVNEFNASGNLHGDSKRGSGGSTVPRNTDQTVSITSPATSTYIFGAAKNLGGSVNSKAHGAREANQKGQWQSENAWDLMVPAFTPIYAIFDGTITNVNFYEDVPFIWGYRFTLVGTNEAFYTHLDRSIYKSGTKVKKGDLIGYIGQPPIPDYKWSTHLHIGLRSGNLSTYLKNDGQII
jgi:murein DD-endopeptidase MepM/ murein hydrolase activator NlpD